MNIIIRNVVILLLLGALSFPAALYADTVYLKNGGRVSGKIVKEDAKTVTIDIGAGTVVQNRADIIRIKKDEDALQLKESEAVSAAEEESATPMLDTGKNKKGLFGIVSGVVDTAFSILKFDFLKKDK